MDALKWRILPLLLLFAAVIVFYVETSPKLTSSDCSLLPYHEYWIRSSRIVTPDGVFAGAVEVKGGRIASVVTGDYEVEMFSGKYVKDYGDAVVMPGLVDAHVHLDEPGRTEWEGFSSGTKAAAAGGVTTVIEMPLNSFPSTVSEETLRLKVKAAEEKIYVDVGFWGGLVPENAFNTTALERLLSAGALGLKCFMCPSGINDFPMTNSTHIKEGLYTLAKYKKPLFIHAEIVTHSESDDAITIVSDPRSYTTYLKTRPASWEENAIRELQTAMEETKVGGPAEGAHIHIAHLSDAGISLDLIKGAKRSGASVTVETAPHYLSFSAEEIRDGDTRFKCSPPIRDKINRQKLWDSLLEGHIDLLSSDHSPTIPSLKLLEQGDFLRAWGGISSLQFDLPATWTAGLNYDITLRQLVKWWSEKPAKLAGQEHNKGAIVIGKHADFVVWEPDVQFELDENYKVFLKHPNVSAYMGRKLSGKVLDTFVRGNLVYSDGRHSPRACGETILPK